jgi:predicted dithiol-disulfide oxidoreductase (DUF899 family)
VARSAQGAPFEGKGIHHMRDKINAERLALPWVKVEKNCVFDTPRGKSALSELFDGRSQLLVYHFMLGPKIWDVLDDYSRTDTFAELARSLLCDSSRDNQILCVTKQKRT